MKAVTMSAKVAGLIGTVFLLSCVSHNPPQLQPTASATPVSIPAPNIVIDSPESSTVGLAVTFRWHLRDDKGEGRYRYKVRLDKGWNACDSGIEESFDADTKNCLSVNLPASRYANESVDFAIQGTDSQGRSFCVQGKRLKVDPRSPSSPTCEQSERITK